MESLEVEPPEHSRQTPSDLTPTRFSLYLLSIVPLPSAYSHIFLQQY